MYKLYFLILLTLYTCCNVILYTSRGCFLLRLFLSIRILVAGQCTLEQLVPSNDSFLTFEEIRFIRNNYVLPLHDRNMKMASIDTRNLFESTLRTIYRPVINYTEIGNDYRRGPNQLSPDVASGISRAFSRREDSH